MTDAIAVLGAVFSRTAVPDCLDAADANDDGFSDVSDAVFQLLFALVGGRLPPAPYLDCSPDPTGDTLAYAAFSEEICPPGGPPIEVPPYFDRGALLAARTRGPA